MFKLRSQNELVEKAQPQVKVNVNAEVDITKINDYEFMFCGCKSLKSIIIPNNVSVIGGLVFRNCESLMNVYIPNSVTGIEELAFDYCPSLSSLVFNGTKKQWKAIKKQKNWRGRAHR